MGKTSLLNFLSVLLDRTRFRTAMLDAQSLCGEQLVSRWLSALGEKGCCALGLSVEELPQLPEDWLEAWNTLSNFLLK